MNIAIRVDASAAMGTGHLVRCRNLGLALRQQGATVRFVCRAHPGHGMDAVREEGFTVTALPEPEAPESESADEDYAGWLGVSQTRDGDETIAALDGRPDWLVVDHYGLDAEWEQRLRHHVERILVIDDLANRDHECDALLDQNYNPNADARYAERLPAGATRLLGPRYALLGPEYAAYRREVGTRSGRVDRMLVFFGGTDLANLTGRALEALSDPDFADVVVDAVLGPNNPHREALVKQAETRPGITLHAPRPHLADLMAAADLAIGAGGATTWERCCLGLPSLVVSIADNQRPACEALAADGLIAYAGHHDKVKAENLWTVLVDMISNPDKLRGIGLAASKLVDGHGAEQSASLMVNTLKMIR